MRTHSERKIEIFQVLPIASDNEGDVTQNTHVQIVLFSKSKVHPTQMYVSFHGTAGIITLLDNIDKTPTSLPEGRRRDPIHLSNSREEINKYFISNRRRKSSSCGLATL